MNQLDEFLHDAEKVLKTIVDNREDLLPAELNREFEEAWQEIPGQFSLVRRQLSLTAPDKLQDAGLSGSQLRLKIAGFQRAYRKLKQNLSLGWIKKVLRWINVILGSLASVIPAAELLKEYKEAVEIGVDEAEDEIDSASW